MTHCQVNGKHKKTSEVIVHYCKRVTPMASLAVSNHIIGYVSCFFFLVSAFPILFSCHEVSLLFQIYTPCPHVSPTPVIVCPALMCCCTCVSLSPLSWCISFCASSPVHLHSLWQVFQPFLVLSFLGFDFFLRVFWPCLCLALLDLFSYFTVCLCAEPFFV